MILRFENLLWQAPGFELRLDVTLTGGVVGLFGESGSGKTTLLNLIAGVTMPASGRIRFDDHLFVDAGAGVSVPARHRHIGYVPQDRALFPHLTVRQNILYGVRARKSRLEDSGVFSIEHVSGLLEITTILERNPETLSGGEQQRVALARALLSRPKLLLFDEPLAGLDENLKDKALGLVARVASEYRIPIVYVSHGAREVSTLCDEILVLARGRLRHKGRPGEVFEEALQPELRVRENFPSSGEEG